MQGADAELSAEHRRRLALDESMQVTRQSHTDRKSVHEQDNAQANQETGSAQKSKAAEQTRETGFLSRSGGR
ncbi:hypothetical protein GCM10025770_09830 [Viridibacterium curvum]|uniref:Uncharacterized protein n=1 Tax=Viridibacterium curvum TaxID=1101404 RepID=A0ABP9QFH0_9RHOO